jgi:hypothetical protein
MFYLNPLILNPKSWILNPISWILNRKSYIRRDDAAWRRSCFDLAPTWTRATSKARARSPATSHPTRNWLNTWFQIRLCNYRQTIITTTALDQSLPVAVTRLGNDTARLGDRHSTFWRWHDTFEQWHDTFGQWHSTFGRWQSTFGRWISRFGR